MKFFYADFVKNNIYARCEIETFSGFKAQANLMFSTHEDNPVLLKSESLPLTKFPGHGVCDSDKSMIWYRMYEVIECLNSMS